MVGRARGATDEQQERALSQITQKICSETGVTVSDFVLGAVYRAAKEGRVVILDEANYIPPGLLAKLNDIMTKVPGEEITVQEDGVGPITVQDGFGIMMTGNMNTSGAKKYKERLELDPALLDRVTLKEYDYLPQAIDGSMEQVTDPNDKQIFEIIIGSLLNDQGALNIPKGALEKLWNFSQYAKLTQMAFAGKIGAGDRNSYQVNGAGVLLQTDLSISPRGLQKIVGEWQKDQYALELDHYIYKHLIARATNPSQRAYLYQLGQNHNFFQNGDWKQPTGAEYSTDLKSFGVDDPRNPEEKTEFVAPTEVVESIYGTPPKRTEWPAGSDTEKIDEQEQSAELDRLQERFEQLSVKVSEWREKIGNVCPVPSAEGEASQAEAAPEAEVEEAENGADTPTE